ncbi:ABC transporter ATP-binding protein [Ilumatobacter nonamiensis]|uniref:ABC transporter ATP-binding protein n=1 Tax=Ilumatobacter nonamiensis TaxID=467093 RepID=UPI00034DE8D4|nr:ABC transporter ATP-binding protein [Ilumatobacter nonamiensis]
MTPNATTTADPSAPPLLRLESVAVAFGGLLALGGIDLDVAQGERLAVLGPNGAGKTTLFNAIAGDITPTKGKVTIKGVDCTALPSRLRPQLGVARTYQKTRLFGGLTVEDNLYLAQAGKRGRHLALRRNKLDAEMRVRAREAGQQVWLGAQLDEKVQDLSHGQQRQLEIGVALVTDPDLIMLDEPASGLSRGERERLIDLLEALPRESTLLLIEHDMDVALKVADRVVVMADGETIAMGTPEEIRSNELVHAIYLGEAG